MSILKNHIRPLSPTSTPLTLASLAQAVQRPEGEIPEKVMARAESIDISAVDSAYIGSLHHVYGEYIEPEGNWEVIIKREGVEPGDDLSDIPYYLVVLYQR